MTCGKCGAPLRESGEGFSRCPKCGSLEGPPTVGASDAPTPRIEQRLASAIAEFEGALSRGETPDIETFCDRHPDLRERLRDALTVVSRSRAAPAVDDAPELPARLGPYRVLGPLGRGGMAPVLRALDERLGREVALKVLVPDPVRGARLRERFMREARALARASHPQVVPVFDVGEDGPWCYLAMELQHGTLADADPPADRHGRRDYHRRAARWMLQAAEGVAHAHAIGVLHRDLKPGNLLVGEDGQVRVGDFGLAWLEGAETLTVAGQAMGTPGFAAPEQMRGAGSDERSDVYGLGTCLYALLRGRAPAWPSLPALARRPRGVPRGLWAVMARAAAHEPEHRYPGARAFADDLRAWIEGRRVRALAPSRRRRAIAAVAVAAAVAAAAGLAAHLRARAALPGGWLLNPTAFTGAIPGGTPLSSRFNRRRARPFERGADGADVTVQGRRYRMRIDRGWTGAEASLWGGGRRLARFELRGEAFGDVKDWTLPEAPLDLDGDGLPDLIVRGASSLALVKWSPAAWGDPALGWHVRTGAAFAYGSPALADADGDGGLDVVVGDTGEREGPDRHPSTLRALRAADGHPAAVWPLRGATFSTPHALAGPDGRARAIYLDTRMLAAPGAAAASTEALLWRVTAGGARPVARTFHTASELTWPVFLDVDGDGAREVVIATRTGRTRGEPGEVHALREDLSGDPLWRLRLGRPPLSYPLASDQDGDGRPDLCFAGSDAFRCIRAAVGLREADRPIWSVPLQWGEYLAHHAIDAGDLDGDGRPDLAFGTTSGRIVVASGRGGGAILAAASVADLTGAPPGEGRSAIHARLALLARGRDRCLLAATDTGWILCAALPDLRPAWSFRALGEVVASPVVVPWSRAGEPAAPAVPAVLVAGTDAWVYLIVPPDRPGDRPAVAWSFRAEHPIGSTPAVRRDGPRTFIHFTDRGGGVYGVPITPPGPIIPPGPGPIVPPG